MWLLPGPLRQQHRKHPCAHPLKHAHLQLRLSPPVSREAKCKIVLVSPSRTQHHLVPSGGLVLFQDRLSVFCLFSHPAFSYQDTYPQQCTSSLPVYTALESEENSCLNCVQNTRELTPSESLKGPLIKIFTIKRFTVSWGPLEMPDVCSAALS